MRRFNGLASGSSRSAVPHGRRERASSGCAATDSRRASVRGAHHRPDEERRAQDQCREPGQVRAKPNIIACYLAIHCGEKFISEKDAERQFGVALSTDLHTVWLDDVCCRSYSRKSLPPSPSHLASSGLSTTLQEPQQRLPSRSSGRPAIAALPPQDAALRRPRKSLWPFVMAMSHARTVYTASTMM